ncbi:MAG: hypothetical protein ACREK6_19760 [Candidatus Rokuibacteriota bacterium]
MAKPVTLRIFSVAELHRFYVNVPRSWEVSAVRAGPSSAQGV